MIQLIEEALTAAGYKVHLKPQEKIPHDKKELTIVLSGCPIDVRTFEEYSVPFQYDITFIATDLTFIETTIKDIVAKVHNIVTTGLFKVIGVKIELLGAAYAIAVVFEGHELVSI